MDKAAHYRKYNIEKVLEIIELLKKRLEATERADFNTHATTGTSYCLIMIIYIVATVFTFLYASDDWKVVMSVLGFVIWLLACVPAIGASALFECICYPGLSSYRSFLAKNIKRGQTIVCADGILNQEGSCHKQIETLVSLYGFVVNYDSDIKNDIFKFAHKKWDKLANAEFVSKKYNLSIKAECLSTEYIGVTLQVD
jgi:hypothetical protein